MQLELKSGEVLEGSVLAKAFNVLVFRTSQGTYKLISKMALLHPEQLKFKFDESEKEEFQSE